MHLHFDRPHPAVLLKFTKAAREGLPGGRCEHFSNFLLADHLAALVAQPLKFCVVDAKEDAIAIERVVPARSGVIEVTDLVRGVQQRLFRTFALGDISSVRIDHAL